MDFDNTFYKDLLKTKDILENSSAYSSNNENNIEFSMEEFQEVLKRVKNGKAVGHDSIPNEILKSPLIGEVLIKFFNKCFTSGLVPDEWSKSLIMPLLKGRNKDSTKLNNYRGISLLPHIYKIYTGLLNQRLTVYLESNGLMADEQNGFRKGRACIDHIYTLTTIIKNRKLANKSTFCCFVDMAKAFDSVDRNCLLHQCLKYGIGGNLYRSLMAIYNKTICSVVIDNKFGTWFRTKSGVKQGDTLSPLLFHYMLMN